MIQANRYPCFNPFPIFSPACCSFLSMVSMVRFSWTTFFWHDKSYDSSYLLLKRLLPSSVTRY
ncbi:hypothetical protein L873DRAFT_1167664 [Choiromyces venosus 120613-1]|uniref:Uncharacterized protein n=1 Tax=Choiromyces venosus 120613-1 TaxID=1336337 RepID=A0A3N4IW68_9PEZI|nr:hypothetical protein L873DRAFT_1167664 [Choiromyces venosus 120613-1]